MLRNVAHCPQEGVSDEAQLETQGSAYPLLSLDSDDLGLQTEARLLYIVVFRYEADPGGLKAPQLFASCRLSAFSLPVYLLDGFPHSLQLFLSL